MNERDQSRGHRLPYEPPRATRVRLDPVRELLQTTGCTQATPGDPTCDPLAPGAVPGARLAN